MFKVFFLISYILLSTNVVAQNAKSTDTSNEESVRDEEISDQIDAVHGFLSTSVVQLAEGIDSYFLSDERVTSINKSRFSFRLKGELKNADGFSTENKLRFRLNLPKLQDLFRLKIDLNPQKDADKKKSASQNIELTKDQWLFHYKNSWEFRVDVSTSPDYRISFNSVLEWSKYRFTARILNRLSETGEEGLLDRLNFETDYQIDTDLLFRLDNEVNWKERDSSVSWRHGPIFYYDLDRKEKLSISALAYGLRTQTSYWSIDYYDVNFTYSRKFYREWILLTIGPGVEFIKDRDFKTDLKISVALDLIFGSV